MVSASQDPSAPAIAPVDGSQPREARDEDVAIQNPGAPESATRGNRDPTCVANQSASPRALATPGNTEAVSTAEVGSRNSQGNTITGADEGSGSDDA